ncbi:MAG: copper amine oxidase N-terminal domain-containing protein [Clostridiales bacterium]|nr:copper amine oxidase N-terminal domain-containing protein [Clostridiales bacterium]
MVPLRYISEQFGARVDYEASSQQISITKMLDVQ